MHFKVGCTPCLRIQVLPHAVIVTIRMNSRSQALEWARSCRADFAAADALACTNLQRIQAAMHHHRIGPHHFAGSTGYGHGDAGRAAFDAVRDRACVSRLGQDVPSVWHAVQTHMDERANTV